MGFPWGSEIFHAPPSAGRAAWPRGADLQRRNTDGRNVLDLVSRRGAPPSMRRQLEDLLRTTGQTQLRSSAQCRDDVDDVAVTMALMMWQSL